MKSLPRILETVAQRITPDTKERSEVISAAEKVRRKVAETAQVHGLNAKVRIDGSVAKDTWLSGEADIDVFMLVSPDLSRRTLETECLDVAREAAGESVKRFAEHPYVETYEDCIRVNIVPCYDVEKGQWRSAADRTPYHTRYMLEKLNDSLRREVRLTKKFAKGIRVYGAEIKTSGFSGMLCEVLALHYQSFQNLVSEAASWKTGNVVDLEKYYENHREDLLDLFPNNLIVIDPVDSGRNVAAAVAQEKMWSFVAASRNLIDKPRLEFFFPQAINPLIVSAAKKKLSKTTGDLLLIEFGSVDTVIDILWSQLYKTERSLKNLLRTNGFTVLRSASWSNEKDRSAIIFELEQTSLPAIYKHLGPPVWRREESNRFLERHLDASDTIVGPRVEGERWVVHKHRRYPSAVELLKEKMRGGGRDVGVAAKVAASSRKCFRILLNEKITLVCREDRGFAHFLTKYLKGRPFWLE